MLESQRNRTIAVGIFAAVAALVVWLALSLLYWAADGGGSPQEFRDRVAATGLEVEWTNNGSRGGDGTVETECGPVGVNVQLFTDTDSFVVFWADDQAPLTAETVERINTCG